MDNGFFWRIGKKEKKRRGNCETGRANFGISRSPTSLSPQKSLNVLSPTPHFPFPFMLFVPFLLLSFFSFSADRNCLLKQWEGKGNTHKKDHTVRKKWKKPRIPSQKKRRKGKGKISRKFGPFCSHMLFLAQSIFLQTGLFLPTSKSILLFFSFSFDALLRTHICKKMRVAPSSIMFNLKGLPFSSLPFLTWYHFAKKEEKKGKW